VGLLAPSSIKKALYFRKKKSGCTESQHCHDVVDNFQREYVMYGEKIYTQMYVEMENCFGQETEKGAGVPAPLSFMDFGRRLQRSKNETLGEEICCDDEVCAEWEGETSYNMLKLCNFGDIRTLPLRSVMRDVIASRGPCLLLGPRECYLSGCRRTPLDAILVFTRDVGHVKNRPVLVEMSSSTCAVSNVLSKINSSRVEFERGGEEMKETFVRDDRVFSPGDDASMKDDSILYRDIYATAISWAVGGSVTQIIDPAFIWASNAQVASRLSTAFLVRADFEVTMTISSTPYHRGMLIASLRPFYGDDYIIKRLLTLVEMEVRVIL
jgi:hypothetical protein